MPEYRLTSDLPYPRTQVFDWHLRPGALERLTPPWADMRVLERTGGPSDGGRVLLQLRRGPLSIKWDIRHTDYEYGRLFRDEQRSGPFSVWNHAHRFDDDESGGTRYSDEVEWVLPASVLSGLALGTSVERELDRLFVFRHGRLRADLDRHATYSDTPLTVAITGASGLLGGQLVTFLTTGGHRVLRLVRRQARTDDEVQWDPATGKLDGDRLEGIDAVVHLAGEPISGGRWTAEKKKRILDSRSKGTEGLSRALADLRSPPKVLVTASAIGIYGDRGDRALDESAKPGSGFLAEVCQVWEDATRPLARRGTTRIAHIRFGLVLSPAGGALGTMLLPFKVGAGGRLGSGRQYVSWIDADDAVALVLHTIKTPELRGPVNGTAPQPVSNATFTSALGRVLGRPTLLPVPRFAIKAMFGEMGVKLLLEGQRVLPKRALDTGFTFRFASLEDALRFQLGEERSGGLKP